jgi:hypothetical protein
MKRFDFMTKIVCTGLLTLILVGSSVGMAAPKEMKLKLNDPGAAAEWTLGASNTVKWSYRGELGATVKITLQRVGWQNARLTIVEAAPIGPEKSGSYKWTVPDTLPPGSNYTIAITAENGLSETSGEFSLVAGKTPLTQISLEALPKGAEKWAIGSPVSLRWTYSGNPGQTVQLALINKADSDLIPIVASIPIGVDGKGRYEWTVPKLKPGGDYYVAIASNTNAFYQDISKTAVVISATK